MTSLQSAVRILGDLVAFDTTSRNSNLQLIDYVEDFLDEPVTRALRERERRAGKLLAVDDDVSAIIQKLKARGLTSPYLRPFVVARVNPIRFSTSTEFDFDDVLERMQRAAAKFNIDRVKQEDVVRAGGGAPEEEE